MSVTQYVGARYVPLFANPIDWDITKAYEPLTIVYHQGNSYTSRQSVPTGTDINNDTYWALTGNYNAQIEQYRAEVVAAKTGADTANATNTTQDAQIAGTSDSGLKTLITNESTARGNKDTALDAQIAGTTDSGLKTLISANTTAISAETTRAKAAENAIFPIKTYNTVADMLTDGDNYSVGDILQTLSFYSIGDNGGGYYVISSTGNPISQSPTIGDCLYVSANKYANLVVPDEIAITMLGATTTMNDCSDIIQRAVNLCKNLYINIPVKIASSISLPMDMKTIRGSRSYPNQIVNNPDILSSSTDYVFTYNIPSSVAATINVNLEFKDLAIQALNGISIGSHEDVTQEKTNEAKIIKPRIINCSFGCINRPTDINAGTATAAEIEELETYGIAIYCGLIFDATIESCYIYKYGVGIQLYSSDLNLINNCRMVSCERFVHMNSGGNFGGRNKVLNCDLLDNTRPYGIVSTKGSYIQNNYFETYSPSGIYLSSGDRDNITGNYITPNDTHAEIALNGLYGIFANNTAPGFTTRANAIFDYSLITNYFNGFTASGNTCINVQTSPFIAPNPSDFYNIATRDDAMYLDLNKAGCCINRLGGSGSTGWHFELQDNGWHFKDDVNHATLFCVPKTNVEYKIYAEGYEAISSTDNEIYINVHEDETLTSTALTKGFLYDGKEITFTPINNIFYVEMTGIKSKVRKVTIEPVTSI